LPENVICTTINKVCASGMKAVMVAAQTIMIGHAEVIVAGGFESMSNVPYYLDFKARMGLKYGNGKVIDGVLHDGLTDVYNQFHMGNCAENTSKKFNIGRKEQDDYAILSYQRAINAMKEGYFKNEIVPITVKGNKKGEQTIVSEDENPKKVQFDKIPTLRPVFQEDGTVTAANSSTLNDGSSALVLMSSEVAKKKGLKPIARIISFADAETKPIDFPISPSLALPIALERAKLKKEDIDLWEINEAFSVVALANLKILGLDLEKLNVNGGGVSLGHPIGSSGSRIITSLIHELKRRKKKYGAAGICNGGGGGSSIIIERLD